MQICLILVKLLKMHYTEHQRLLLAKFISHRSSLVHIIVYDHVRNLGKDLSAHFDFHGTINMVDIETLEIA